MRLERTIANILFEMLQFMPKTTCNVKETTNLMAKNLGLIIIKIKKCSI